MIPLPKRLLLGSMIAVGGAFAWIFIAFLPHAWSGGWLPRMPLLAGYAVLLTSWFVLPLGAAIGASMPVIIRGRSLRTVFVRGLIVGALTGFVVATVTILLEYFPTVSGPVAMMNPDSWHRAVFDRYMFYSVTMMLVCAPWVGVWAYSWRRNLDSAAKPRTNS